MILKLPSGLGGQAVDLPGARPIDGAGQIAGETPPGGAPAQQVRAALEAPIGYPPLRQAVVPGDHVALALGPDIPALAEVVRGLLEALQACGCDGLTIDLLTLGADDAASAERGVEASGIGASGVTARVSQHNGDDDSGMAFAGMARDGSAVSFNRVLLDADVLIPVGCNGADEDGSAYAGLYPAFADRATARRLAGTAPADVAAAQDEAGWLAGAAMVVRIVAAAGGGVAHALAGAPEEVAARAAEISRATWRRTVGERSRLVLVTIGGDGREATWGALARAVDAASAGLLPGGAVAVCADVTQPLGKSLGRLVDAEDLGDAARRAARDQSWDAQPAVTLAKAIGRGPVFLLSRRNPDEVESLGLAPIADPTELSRLATRMGDCLVIEDAHRVAIVADAAAPMRSGG
ncbi:hypothetical protein Pla175_48010 [Pirellulimonas nuda]|uniref:LarA-like N-terminal domain-containing protein n=1 Tax=Pirellulimonas nuda TaxID=2528009 RepID=A0A518DIS2_9BACT|nr:lactate racemase domain-containing protein [Pirellulimonas nuda]QDU91379.1 hypothetical protein Pla175_48010 [Pirellulimonas nuda]